MRSSKLTALRIFLVITTVTIFTVSIYVALTQGINWPAVYFGDLLSLDWRSQFNTDFLAARALTLLSDGDPTALVEASELCANTGRAVKRSGFGETLVGGVEAGQFRVSDNKRIDLTKYFTETTEELDSTGYKKWKITRKETRNER